MPSTSKKQHNFMEAVAHSPSFAKKAGVPQSVGKDFSAADKGRKFSKGGNVALSEFERAFKAHRALGDKEFEFNGKKYNTKYAEEQPKRKVITDYERDIPNNVRESVARENGRRLKEIDKPLEDVATLPPIRMGLGLMANLARRAASEPAVQSLKDKAMSEINAMRKSGNDPRGPLQTESAGIKPTGKGPSEAGKNLMERAGNRVETSGGIKPTGKGPSEAGAAMMERAGERQVAESVADKANRLVKEARNDRAAPAETKSTVKPVGETSKVSGRGTKANDESYGTTPSPREFMKEDIAKDGKAVSPLSTTKGMDRGQFKREDDGSEFSFPMKKGGKVAGKGSIIGYAEGGMTMVNKGGKMVPDFAADGVGKMAKGGMAKFEKSGKDVEKKGMKEGSKADMALDKKQMMGMKKGGMSCMNEGGMARGEHSIQKKGFTKGKEPKMERFAKGGFVGSASKRADGCAIRGKTRG